MDKCGICLKPAVQLFETGKDGVYACFKCQPLVPEVSIGENSCDPPEAQTSNSDEKNVQLQNHMRNHRAERRFVCTYCNKAFSQSNNLRAHLRIHTNERPFKCSDCGKAFTQVTNLNNHVRLHTGERPFVCPEPGCDKAYAQVTNLNQHRKRHLNGRPVETTYDCTVCGEQFQQRNHMYNHRREAHVDVKSVSRSPNQRRVCLVCELNFPNERMLQQHVAEHVAAGDAQHEPEDTKRVYPCVFSTCSSSFSSPRAHTDHLLRAHQLRVLHDPHAPHDPRAPHAAAHHPPRRGRPPKVLKEEDPLQPKENMQYHEVTIIKQSQPQYLPKLKVQSLFQ